MIAIKPTGHLPIRDEEDLSDPWRELFERSQRELQFAIVAKPIALRIGFCRRDHAPQGLPEPVIGSVDPQIDRVYRLVSDFTVCGIEKMVWQGGVLWQ